MSTIRNKIGVPVHEKKDILFDSFFIAKVPHDNAL